jgi:hypothetical protein
MKSRFLQIIITVVTSIIILSTQAFGASLMLDKLNDDNLAASTEKDEVVNNISKSTDWIKYNFKDKKVKVEPSKAFKIYGFNSLDFKNELKKNRKIEGIISKDYMWEIPMYDDNGVLFSSCVAQKDEKGKWYIGQLSSSCTQEMLKLVVEKSQLEILLNKNGISKVDKFKIFNIPNLFACAIYLKSGTDEYIVPFTAREDLFSFKNSTVYKVADFINLTSQYYNADPGADGGAMIDNQTTNLQDVSPVNYFISIAAIISIVLVVLAFLVIRTRKARMNN